MLNIYLKKMWKMKDSMESNFCYKFNFLVFFSIDELDIINYKLIFLIN